MTMRQIRSHVPLVEEISLSKNSVVGIIGPTGSGKSALMNYFLKVKLSYVVDSDRGRKYLIKP